MTTAKNGMSAKTLQRTLGTSYRVAWVMLQRYRVAMVRPNRSLLAGNVEVDETLVGGVKKKGKRGRGAHKSIVVIAVEVENFQKDSEECVCDMFQMHPAIVWFRLCETWLNQAQ